MVLWCVLLSISYGLVVRWTGWQYLSVPIALIGLLIGLMVFGILLELTFRIVKSRFPSWFR